MSKIVVLPALLSILMVLLAYYKPIMVLTASKITSQWQSSIKMQAKCQLKKMNCRLLRRN